jgi:hypothetical protein
VGGCFQVRPKEESPYWYFRIPPTEVGGFYKSSLLAHNTASTITKSVRLDLNYPPTPVGGIADFDEDAAENIINHPIIAYVFEEGPPHDKQLSRLVETFTDEDKWFFRMASLSFG